jgi:hypothetical protein
VTGLAVTLSCSPQVVSYQAVPRRLCPGSSTLLTWSVKGSATLAAEPPIPGTGDVRSTDSARFTPLQTTVFTLTARRHGTTAYARQEVSVLDPATPPTLADTTGALGTDSLQVIARWDSTLWDSRARVADVFGRSGRWLAVRHAGRWALVSSDGVASRALRDTPLAGDWVIHAPLEVGEVIGDPTHPPAARLRLGVRFYCGP